MTSDGLTTDPGGIFADLIVVEVGELASFAARILADGGATVVKVEQPGGDASRRYLPGFDGSGSIVDQPGLCDDYVSVYWAYYNAGKRSLEVDYGSAANVLALTELIARADVVMDGSGSDELASAGLSREVLSALNATAIYVRATPFGDVGPWAGYKNCDLVSLALSGMLNDCGYDDHAIPPIAPQGNQSLHTMSTKILVALSIAMLWRQSTGEGQWIDLTIHDSLLSTIEFSDMYWWFNQAYCIRQTSRQAFPQETDATLYETADGKYVVGTLILHHEHVWQSIKTWLDKCGILLDLADPLFDDPVYRRANQHVVFDRIKALALMLPADEFYRGCQSAGWVVGPLRYPDELFDDEQLNSRGFWRTLDVHGRSLKFPGEPFRVQGAAFTTGSVASPGEYNAHTGQRLRPRPAQGTSGRVAELTARPRPARRPRARA